MKKLKKLWNAFKLSGNHASPWVIVGASAISVVLATVLHEVAARNRDNEDEDELTEREIVALENDLENDD